LDPTKSRETKEQRRRGGDHFFALRYDVLRSPEFSALSAIAVKLLLDLVSQFSGTNNGDLSPSWRLMKARGWKSKDTLDRALRELVERQWLVRTRPGGRNLAALYAMTFRSIDECGRKHDIAPTTRPGDDWRRGHAPLVLHTAAERRDIKAPAFPAKSLPRSAGQHPDELPRSAGQDKRIKRSTTPPVVAVGAIEECSLPRRSGTF
jgi:hypothetical protein